jgi:hypothetical protein
LNSELLGYDTIGIAAELLSFLQSLQTIGFHFGFQNSFIAHYPDNFINYVVLGLQAL